MSKSSTSTSGNSHANKSRPPLGNIPQHLRASNGANASVATVGPESSPAAGTAPVDFDPSSSREALIATAAYYRAEKRGFAPGHETEDWLAAESEVDAFGADLAL
jgi:hypothetical protein